MIFSQFLHPKKLSLFLWYFQSIFKSQPKISRRQSRTNSSKKKIITKRWVSELKFELYEETQNNFNVNTNCAGSNSQLSSLNTKQWRTSRHLRRSSQQTACTAQHTVLLQTLSRCRLLNTAPATQPSGVNATRTRSENELAAENAPLVDNTPIWLLLASNFAMSPATLAGFDVSSPCETKTS